MRRIVLLRHGRTAINAQARLQGHVDASLDDVGREQAALAASRLRGAFDVGRVVSSSLRRTQETARALRLADDALEVDDRWREIDFGRYDTRPIREVVTELGARWAEDIHHEPIGGESIAALHARVGAAWAEILEHSDDESVTVVVTHATPIKSAVVHALAGTADQILQLKVNLASITVVELDPSFGLVLARFNDIAHLAGDDQLAPGPIP